MCRNWRAAEINPSVAIAERHHQTVDCAEVECVSCGGTNSCFADLDQQKLPVTADVDAAEESIRFDQS